MKKLLLKSALFFVVPILFAFSPAQARENVTDWYIKDFNAAITVNKDSSLDIVETITADCGEAQDKHGIFRILPYEINIIGKGWVKTPVELVSIKDESGASYHYTIKKNSYDKTVTWKIGDPDKTVQGENVYVISYRVQNAIRFWNASTDELYWNLVGNFWDIEIDRARVELSFPAEINSKNTAVDLYSGLLEEETNEFAGYNWVEGSKLVFESTRTLPIKTGITASMVFPKNIFIPYQESLWLKYGEYLFLLLPVLIFFFCFKMWSKYGNDPKSDKAVIAEYEAPANLSLIETGLLLTNGNLKNQYITATIVGFAVKGIISIKEIENKILFFSSKDYELARLGNAAESALDKAEKIVLEKIFGSETVVELSSLKKEFYKVLSEVKDAGNDSLFSKGLIVKKGLQYGVAFLVLGFVLIFLSIVFLQLAAFGAAVISVFLSGLILVVFGLIMPKRTELGVETVRKLKGFKLFMETVDKDRAAFYEKENIFEKFLPFAILFGITSLWIKRIKELYGNEYFTSHAPVWYAGNHLGSFDADSFTETMNDLSHGIAASTSAPSGSGGAGGAGGGGGGGGGGGW